MKVSIGGKERWSYLRRVEKITERLGIEDEKITDTELHQQYPLKMLWKRIHKHWDNKEWDEFDKAQEEVEVLLSKVDALKDTYYFEKCIRVRVYSHKHRKDGNELRKALAKHKDINMEKIFSDNADIAWRYIDIMNSCFAVGVADEGFSLMQQVNALLISPT